MMGKNKGSRSHNRRQLCELCSILKKGRSEAEKFINTADDVNMEDIHGNTILHLAVLHVSKAQPDNYEKRADTLIYLADYCDKNRRNHHGLYPFDYLWTVSFKPDTGLEQVRKLLLVSGLLTEEIMNIDNVEETTHETTHDVAQETKARKCHDMPFVYPSHSKEVFYMVRDALYPVLDLSCIRSTQDQDFKTRNATRDAALKLMTSPCHPVHYFPSDGARTIHEQLAYDCMKRRRVDIVLAIRKFHDNMSYQDWPMCWHYLRIYGSDVDYDTFRQLLPDSYDRKLMFMRVLCLWLTMRPVYSESIREILHHVCYELKPSTWTEMMVYKTPAHRSYFFNREGFSIEICPKPEPTINSPYRYGERRFYTLVGQELRTQDMRILFDLLIKHSQFGCKEFNYNSPYNTHDPIVRKMVRDFLTKPMAQLPQSPRSLRSLSIAAVASCFTSADAKEKINSLTYPQLLKDDVIERRCEFMDYIVDKLFASS